MTMTTYASLTDYPRIFEKTYWGRFAAEMGHQNLTINDAIDGTWSPVPDESVDVETGEIAAAE